MTTLWQSAGIFIYPLLICSLIAVFIISERLLSLRSKAVLPKEEWQMLSEGKLPPTEKSKPSTGGRIVDFFLKEKPNPEALKAYAQWEVTRMERGLFLLDIVISAAPLLGLLGTVTGLIQVFANISPETGLPETGSFIQGVALALTTTMLGLSIAIPALVGSGYLNRRIDVFASRIQVLVESLMHLPRSS